MPEKRIWILEDPIQILPIDIPNLHHYVYVCFITFILFSFEADENHVKMMTY